jgi:hypothetical protein
MQAYLGSRLIDVAMTDSQYRNGALKSPGRELLIALVLRSRAEARETRPIGRTPHRIAKLAGNQRPHLDLLLDAAQRRTDVKALYMYAAAMEIDSADDAPAHRDIAEKLQQRSPGSETDSPSVVAG